MAVVKTVETFLARCRAPKRVRPQLFFCTVLVLVLAATFVISAFPFNLYTPTVGFQEDRHRRMLRIRSPAPAVSPAGKANFRAYNHRVVVVGDLHGDLDRLRNVLRAADVLDVESDRWRDGCTDYVVQLGDVVDRGPDAPAILELLQRLRGEATKSGGQVITLVGNHELMSLMGSTHYVHPALLNQTGGQQGFRHLFGVGGRYGRMFLEDSFAAVIINDVVYVHGGLTASYAAGGLGRLNDELWYRGLLQPNLSQHAFHASDSPLWDRSVIAAAMRKDCAPLEEALSALSKVEKTPVGAMVVGHTVMGGGKIGSWCGGRLVAADVGMSRYMNNGGYEAYVTVDPFTSAWKRKKASTASRIHAKYPIGAGVHATQEPAAERDDTTADEETAKANETKDTGVKRK